MPCHIWCEFLSPKEVLAPGLLETLAELEAGLYYKLEYREPPSTLFPLLDRCAELGVPVHLWLTLSDQLGYWVNERNAAEFRSHVHRTLDQIAAAGRRVAGVCVDLEPPLRDVLALKNPANVLATFGAYARMLTVNLDHRRFEAAQSELRAVHAELDQRGLESCAVFLRHLYYDLRFGTMLLQDALETPVFDVPWHRLNAMYYATMLRDELKNRTAAEVDDKILREVSLLHEKFGPRLEVSVGVVNPGKLENEACYSSLDEFAHDIGVLKACGVESFALFSLDGLTDPGRLRSYLEAMRSAEPVHPAPHTWVERSERRSGALIRLGDGYRRLLPPW